MAIDKTEAPQLEPSTRVTSRSSYPSVAAETSQPVSPPALVPDDQSWEVAAQIAAHQRNRGAALQSTFDPPYPPPPAIHSVDVSATTTSTTTLEATVIRATVPIVPTLYPGDPSGTVIVQNHITINVDGPDIRALTDKLKPLLYIGDKAAGTVIAATVAAAIALLSKLTGLW